MRLQQLVEKYRVKVRLKKHGKLPNGANTTFKPANNYRDISAIEKIFNNNLNEPLPFIVGVFNKIINNVMLKKLNVVRALTDKDNNIIGGFAYRIKKDILHISLLAMDKKTLIRDFLHIVNEIKTVASTLKIRKITCFMNPGDKKIEKLYKSLGFEPVKKIFSGLMKMEAPVENFGERIINIAKKKQ
jgi:hypothetical protein